MINLAPVLFENMTVTFMDIPNYSNAFPASVTKNEQCQERWDDSHLLIYHPCRYLLYRKTIVCSIYRYQCDGDRLSPFLHFCWFAKVTDFLPFCTFVITDNYHTPLLFPTYLPQAYSPLEHCGQKDKILHPLFPKLFFFSTERAGPYPQVQLYWAGQTMRWMANWTRNYDIGAFSYLICVCVSQ